MRGTGAFFWSAGSQRGIELRRPRRKRLRTPEDLLLCRQPEAGNPKSHLEMFKWSWRLSPRDFGRVWFPAAGSCTAARLHRGEAGLYPTASIARTDACENQYDRRWRAFIHAGEGGRTHPRKPRSPVFWLGVCRLVGGQRQFRIISATERFISNEKSAMNLRK